MSVKVSGITKVFGTQKAVNDLSFEAKPGEILGFLGPNGAGKTTTMKMICCYIQPSEGTAEVDGYDIMASPLSVRKRIGYLPEHNPLYEEMYVKEFLQFVASIHKIDNKLARINDVIEMTGLGTEQTKIIGTLSKGYRQRVGLAQAIMHDPSVLILDEPTSGLDMNQLVEIRSLIKNLGKEKTVIFSSHIMQEVQALCDRVIIINNGILVADQSMHQLSSTLTSGQVIHIEFAENEVSPVLFDQIKGLTSITKDHNKLIFKAEKNADIRKSIFDTAVNKSLTILEMRQEKASMEDIFRKLTKERTNV
ncbi:MAG: gliding motility-associated ABC transporter ATP-binding subunit GldA [Saprospiraceae bacterium]|jgi:ABC-2 type transport system ATP-binding protein|nr:gliding motility-associated ABC transporter ATP-binding subunit GldA [Saprospiraceae bacterium]